MHSFALIAAALLQAAAPAAQPASAPAAPQHIDISKNLISGPDTTWNAYGPDQTSKKVDKGGPKNYPYVEVTVAKASANPWDDGVVSPITKPIAAGDVILVAMYLRNPVLSDGQTETLPTIGATGASAPYPGIAAAPANVTNQWKLYWASGKAPQAFAGNGAQTTVHLASAKHVIDVGPVMVYDFGPNFDIRRLPH